MSEKNPFHSGELEAQKRAGESAIARRTGGAISDSILPGARPFLKQQPMIVFGSRDKKGRMWASMVFGRPGFLSADGGKQLLVDLNLSVVDAHDPVWENMTSENRLASLVIELSTRRRIRINGPAHLDQTRQLRIDVEESFPACPKYITRRVVQLASHSRAPGELSAIQTENDWPNEVEHLVRGSDVMFVASQSPECGYDVSHRGGSPGFIQVKGPGLLRWPEFPGNSMFNTLGNLLHDPHAGLVIPDFQNGRVLQMTGTATPRWEQPDPNGESGGTGRFVDFHLEGWRMAELPSLQSELLEYSPFNPPVAS